jgi:uncharacterized membrane protein YfcA
MILEPLLIVELAALGLCTGFLAGLLGIGGGMIMVPFLTVILSGRGVAPDLAVKMAIATSMATIIFTSVSACERTTNAARSGGTSSSCWHQAS